MIEAPRGADLWDPGWRAGAIVITTNGDVNRYGEAVMGRGCAREAAYRIDNLRKRFGDLLKLNGNCVQVIEPAYLYRPVHVDTCAVVSFPVKHHWQEDADLELIRRSAVELVKLTNARKWQKIVMPRPGCGNGRLQWDDVYPVIVPHLDDRFVMVHK